MEFSSKVTVSIVIAIVALTGASHVHEQLQESATKVSCEIDQVGAPAPVPNCEQHAQDAPTNKFWSLTGD